MPSPISPLSGNRVDLQEIVNPPSYQTPDWHTIYATADGLMYDGVRVWTAGLVGDGSGVDADTVDGFHARYDTLSPRIVATDNSGGAVVSGVFRMGSGSHVQKSASGNIGGSLILDAPGTSSLSGGIRFELFSNMFRIREANSTNRVATLDLIVDSSPGNLGTKIAVEKNVVPDTITRVVKPVGSSLAPGEFSGLNDATIWARSRPSYNLVLQAQSGNYLVGSTPVALGAVSPSGSGTILQGDTRNLAGLAYISGSNSLGIYNNIENCANGGQGLTYLSNFGNSLSVRMSTTNPNFVTDGWGLNDRVYTVNNSAARAIYTIQACSNNVITLTTTAPAVGSPGSMIALIPDRAVYGSAWAMVNVWGSAKLKGFLLQPSANNGIGIYMDRDSRLTIENCLVLSACWGVSGTVGMELQETKAVTFARGPSSFSNQYGLLISGGKHNVPHVTVEGFPTCVDLIGATVDASNIRTLWAQGNGASIRYGSMALFNGYSVCIGARAFGWYTETNSLSYNTTLTANFANTTDYSPAAADTEGNIYGISRRT